MKNVEEHKKLLAQIAELEKDSTNFFDVEKEFFLIDSNNLSEVKTKFYGYSIQATGIYEQDNLTEDAVKNLDGRGCYVYVEVKDGQITIKQDVNGCWGIYLFRHGDYFALSNSFFRLLDHVKFLYPLTVNRDYCNYLLVNKVSSHSYFETAVNEIRLVERNAVFYIDTAKKQLEIDLIDYREHTLSLNSKEGVANLDSWVDIWSNVLRGVTHHTKFFQATLSGGFDTRISFVFLLNSGIDLNKIRIYSNEDGLHTHKEDFAIASQIAEHYGFKLNQPLARRQFLNNSISDTFAIDLYVKQTFSNLPYYGSAKAIDKSYSLEGAGGEIIRGNWLRFGSMEKFWQRELRIGSKSRILSREISDSVKNILESAFSAFRDKYKIEDPDSLWLAQYLYQDTRCRHHFGKMILKSYFANGLTFSPALDPKVKTLKLETSECPDPKLLIALLFTRYAPDLLKFPFEGKRSIAPETIACAQKLNERFPRNFLSDKDIGGGFRSIYNREICKPRKFLLRGKTINLFRENFLKLA